MPTTIFSTYQPDQPKPTNSWNLVQGLILGRKQHRMSRKRLIPRIFRRGPLLFSYFFPCISLSLPFILSCVDFIEDTSFLCLPLSLSLSQVLTLHRAYCGPRVEEGEYLVGLHGGAEHRWRDRPGICRRRLHHHHFLHRHVHLRHHRPWRVHFVRENSCKWRWRAGKITNYESVTPSVTSIIQ